MASAIGDGLLGFIAGAADAGARIEGQKIQSDIALERQLSLLQVQRSLAEQDNADLQQQLFESISEEDREAIGVESPGDLVRFLDPGGRAITETIGKTKEAEAEQERQRRELEGITRFLGGNATPEEQARLVQGGVLSVEDLQQDETAVTPAMLRTIPEFANEPEAVLKLFANNQKEAIEFLRGNESSGKLPIDLVNISTGQVETVPFAEAKRLLEAGTHAKGEIVFSGGQQVIRTSRGEFPLPTNRRRSEDLTDRATTFSRLGDAVRELPEARQAQIAEADPEFIRPTIAIDLATGPQDRLFSGLRAFGATNALLNADDSELGEAQLALKKELLALRSLTRNALVAANPGRANAATIQLADELSPTDSTIANIFGSGDNVRLTLENLRGLMRSIRTTNQETVEGSFTPQTADQANEAINNVNRVIGRIESLFASEQIGQLRVKGKDGRTRTVANGLKTSASVANFLRENSDFISRKDKALLFQWQRHLMLQEGF